jgi:ElaB/YqjD/DUF883 family membrane-anchored ribosome-binding protein
LDARGTDGVGAAWAGKDARRPLYFTPALGSEGDARTVRAPANLRATGVNMETYFPTMEQNQSRLARERVMEDLKALASDAEELLRATAGDASDKAKEARARMAAALDRAKTTYEEIQEQSIESAKAAMKQADETIRAHPYQSLGVAFGVGLLIGALLRRK